MEKLLHLMLPEIISTLELIGVLIIFGSSLKTFVLYLIWFFWGRSYPVKRELAFSLALALEYKMGAEILKTVLIRDMQEIWMLGAIIILRALLSLLIHFEMRE